MRLIRALIKRLARVLRRLVPPVPAETDPNPFPIDAWTDPAYAAWFEKHQASEDELACQRVAETALTLRPQFSLIVPLYRTPLAYLETMAASVLAQTYQNLQLVLVNASPELEELAAAIDALAARDTRVRVVTLEANLGITENTNCGLAAATGEFCCFLDHDDAIEPNLLFEYASAVNAEPDLDVLYCDEDLVSYDRESGAFRHLHPLFKPQAAPELMLCKNGVVHLMAIRRSLIDKMPPPDVRFDGAQDYNMFLWCAGAARRVRGVPKVLYHWRISDESTAANPDAKPYSQKAYRLAASGELARRAPNGRIVASGIVNVHNVWFKNDGAAKVSVVVDVQPWVGEAVVAAARAYNTIDRFVEFFEQNNSYSNVEVLLVGEGMGARVLGAPFRAVPCDQAAGRYARLNAGARAATGDYLVFLDAGCLFDTPEPLEQLTAACALTGVGVAAPKTLYRDGRTKAYGVGVTPVRIMPLYRGYEDDFPGYQCNLRAFQDASAAALQGLTVARALFERVGGFDECFESEVGAAELCWRVRGAGLRVSQLCTVKLRCDDVSPQRYFVAGENAPDYSFVDIVRYDAKWPGARTGGDPYLNPNLDQSSSYFQLPQA